MNNTSFHDGAKAATAALLAIPETVASKGQTSTFEYYARRDLAVSKFLTAAGEVSPRAAGVIACLAEFIVSQEQDGCYVELSSNELPPIEAAMTEEERQSYRQALADDVGDLEEYRTAVLARISTLGT